MKENTVIIGAGISGLSAAYFLKKPHIVLEKESAAGGLCRSFYENGFTFDCSGHFFHIKDESIKDLVSKMSAKVDCIEREAVILFKNNFIPYPFQASLYYLPEKIKQDCIDGILKRSDVKISANMPFIDWSKNMFGSGITKYFMQPYNAKLWSYDLKKLNAQWTGAFVPKPDAESIIMSASKKNETKYGYNVSFYYPKKGGAQALINGFLKKIKPLYNAETSKIDLKKKIVETKDGRAFNFGSIISSQSLKCLIKQIKNVPPQIQKAANCLISNSILCINIGVKSKLGAPDILKGIHWIYIPEEKFSFYRIGVYSNVNPSLAPKNCYSFYIEYSSINGKFSGAKNIVSDLQKAGFIRQGDEIAAINEIKIPTGYVIFDKNRDDALKTINRYLLENNIYSIGRYGAWEYSFVEKNIKDAYSIAQIINGGN